MRIRLGAVNHKARCPADSAVYQPLSGNENAPVTQSVEALLSANEGAKKAEQQKDVLEHNNAPSIL